jgi:hypothetical protein
VNTGNLQAASTGHGKSRNSSLITRYSSLTEWVDKRAVEKPVNFLKNCSFQRGLSALIYTFAFRLSTFDFRLQMAVCSLLIFHRAAMKTLPC